MSQGDSTKPELSIYYYRAKARISQEDFRHFGENAEKQVQTLYNLTVKITDPPKKADKKGKILHITKKL